MLATVLFATLGQDSCQQPPTARVLTTTIETSTDHFHILSEIGIEVHIEDDAGEHVMDFEEVYLEVRAAGSETWRAIELAVGDGHYAGTRTFSSSGEYTFRVMGMENAGDELVEMGSRIVQVVRAHVVTGLYRIEYENDPGHIHAGDTDIIPAFWVFLDNEDRDPVTGLDAQIVVEESDGIVTTYDALEDHGAVYWAEAGFAVDGEASVTIQFTGSDGLPAEAEFHVHVAAVH